MARARMRRAPAERGVSGGAADKCIQLGACGGVRCRATGSRRFGAPATIHAPRCLPFLIARLRWGCAWRRGMCACRPAIRRRRDQPSRCSGLTRLRCCRAACRQVEAGQLRKGDFFEFKGKRCVVIKTSQQINNRKLFAIVEFRETESGAKHRETIQAAVLFEKFFVTGQKFNFLYFDEGQDAVYFQDPETFEQV